MICLCKYMGLETLICQRLGEMKSTEEGRMVGIELSDEQAYRYARIRLGFFTYWKCRLADKWRNFFRNQV